MDCFCFQYIRRIKACIRLCFSSISKESKKTSDIQETMDISRGISSNNNNSNIYGDKIMSDTRKPIIDIDKITESQYVLGVRKQKQYKIIDVALPNDWSIPEKFFPNDTPFFVNTNDDTPGIYSFFSETKEFSDIYILVMDIVKYNKEFEEKTLLLNQMQQQLQALFENMDLHQFQHVRVEIDGASGYHLDVSVEGVDNKKDNERNGEIPRP